MKMRRPEDGAGPSRGYRDGRVAPERPTANPIAQPNRAPMAADAQRQAWMPPDLDRGLRHSILDCMTPCDDFTPDGADVLFDGQLQVAFKLREHVALRAIAAEERG